MMESYQIFDVDSYQIFDMNLVLIQNVCVYLLIHIDMC